MTTSPQTPETLTPELRAEELRTIGFARVREAIFDAVDNLWQQRRTEGMTKKDIANSIGYHPSQITRALAGPGNWTLETIGALVEAMDGDLHVEVKPRTPCVRNHDIYAELIDGAAHRFCPAPKVINNTENWSLAEELIRKSAATVSDKRRLTPNIWIRREMF